MTTTRTWYHRLSQWWSRPDVWQRLGIELNNQAFPETASVPAKNPPVVIGCFNHRGHWYLCSSTLEMKGRTVYAITIGKMLVDQYDANKSEYDAIQQVLSDTPKSLRRRKPAAKVEILDAGEVSV